MSILTRYVTREIVKHLCIVLVVVIAIYLAVDFFEKIDSFLEAGVPATRAFWFFLFRIPLIVMRMLPISFLLAILVTFGLMSKRNELIALKSSGVSIYHLFKSVAILGILAALILLFLSERVVPASMARSSRIWRQDVKGGSALDTRENIWLKRDHAFFKIDQYDPVGRVMYGFTAYFVDDRFQLVRRLDAQRGTFEDGRWDLENLLEQKFDPASGDPTVTFQDHQVETIELKPDDDDLFQVTKKTEEKNIEMLRADIERLEAEGANPTRYRVDLHSKMAFPVICLIMCLIGTGVGVRARLKGGLPVIVSYGIGIAFLYYILLSFCVSLGYGGILPPVVAAWAANFIFLCLGGITLISAQ